MDEKKVPEYPNPSEQGYINPGHPSLIRLYANTFVIGPNAGDMYMIGVLNNSPLFVVNMSFETAKTLRQTLDNLIDNFEKDAEITIKTLGEIQDTLLKNASKK